MTATALLLLDLQRGLCLPDGLLGGPSGLADQVAEREVLANAGRALANARSQGHKVIHVRLAFDAAYANRTNRSARFATYEDEGTMQIGTTDTEFCDEVAPQAGEPVFSKGCVNPFPSTGLLATLHSQRIERLVLAGVATNLVVESTARDATDRGFAVQVLEDACASFNMELHGFSRDKTLPLFSDVIDVASYSR